MEEVIVVTSNIPMEADICTNCKSLRHEHPTIRMNNVRDYSTTYEFSGNETYINVKPTSLTMVDMCRGFYDSETGCGRTDCTVIVNFAGKLVKHFHAADLP